MQLPLFSPGDLIRKTTGDYHCIGRVISGFITPEGKPRNTIAILHIIKGSLIHIINPNQFRLITPDQYHEERQKLRIHENYVDFLEGIQYTQGQSEDPTG